MQQFPTLMVMKMITWLCHKTDYKDGFQFLKTMKTSLLKVHFVKGSALVTVPWFEFNNIKFIPSLKANDFLYVYTTKGYCTHKTLLIILNPRMW